MFRFQANFPSVTASTAATGWLTSILQLGGLLGSLTAGTLSDIISRKYTMFIACLWVILGSFLYIGASDNKADLLYAGRFFTGIGVGLFSGVGPLYNAELSAPEMRGLLVSFYQVSPDENTQMPIARILITTTVRYHSWYHDLLLGGLRNELHRWHRRGTV